MAEKILVSLFVFYLIFAILAKRNYKRWKKDHKCKHFSFRWGIGWHCIECGEKPE